MIPSIRRTTCISPHPIARCRRSAVPRIPRRQPRMFDNQRQMPRSSSRHRRRRKRLMPHRGSKPLRGRTWKAAQRSNRRRSRIAQAEASIFWSDLDFVLIRLEHTVAIPPAWFCSPAEDRAFGVFSQITSCRLVHRHKQTVQVFL